MKSCPNCKKPVEEGLMACAHCGFPLDPAGNPHPESGAHEREAHEREAHEREAENAGGSGARAYGSFRKEARPDGAGKGAEEGAEKHAGERAGERAAERPEKVLGEAVVSAGRLVLAASVIDLPFQPGAAELLVGRADPASGVIPEIDLTGHGGDIGGVSRRHARLALREGEVFIEDLNSRNFTFLNRKRLQPGQLYPVHDGDEIRLGNLVLVYHLK
jgi:hypothetical protein